MCPSREDCPGNPPPNYCQHHGDMKLEEEATDVGAEFVLLATAGGSPWHPPPTFNAMLVRSSFLRLDGKGWDKNTAHFSFCRQERGIYAKDGAGDIQKLMKETLQKSICAQYCVGNIWAIRQTYWITETTCRIWGEKKQQPKTHFVFPSHLSRILL